MRNLRSKATALVGVALLSASCTTDWHADTFGVGDTPTIVQGTVQLIDPNGTNTVEVSDYTCRGDGVYRAFGSGLEAVLTDQHGSVVAEARTQEAGPVHGFADAAAGPYCTTNFVLKDVTYHSDSYTIAVGEPGTAVYATATFTGSELEQNRRWIQLDIEVSG